MRFFDTQGTPTGNETLVDNSTDNGFEFLHRLAVLSNDDFVIYFSETGIPSGPLFRRTFQSDGAPSTPREEIINTAVFAQSGFVQFSDTGYYAIAEQSFDTISLFSTVPFTIADLAPFQLNDAGTTPLRTGLLSVNSNNRLVAGWQQENGAEREIRFTMTQDYNVIASRTLVTNEYYDSPSMQIAENGKTLFAWAGIAPDTTDGEVNNAIYASLFSGSGVEESAAILLDNESISSLSATQTSVAPDNNFLVAWTGAGYDGSDIKNVVRIQKIDPAGNPLWNQTNVSSGGGGGSIGYWIYLLLIYPCSLYFKSFIRALPKTYR